MNSWPTDITRKIRRLEIKFILFFSHSTRNFSWNYYL